MAFSKAVKEDRERFAKCFAIISENCQLWILKFVENRIQDRKPNHEKNLIDFSNSWRDFRNDEMMQGFLGNQALSLSPEMGISELCVLIKSENLLEPGELKSVGHQNNTTGDQIDRICEMQNTFMHTAEPNLDESDYDDHINDFKDIGKRFEVINGEKNGTYTMQIEEIHDTPFQTWKVECIVTRHKIHVEKAITEDRKRFAKCFAIISENCVLWILKFVENRIQQEHGKTLIDFINSSPDIPNDTILKDFLIRRKSSLSSKIDFSALCVVIKTGKLLKRGIPGELKSVGHQQNTTGDQIDRIREIRNSFMHTAETNLDESDYDEHINELKDIGKRFEVINGEQNDTYILQIEEIHNTCFDTNKVEGIVTRHKLYVEMTIKQDRERFAKCFVIITENCKLWILKFVENRIKQDHRMTMIRFINSSPNVRTDHIVTEFLKKRKTSSSSEIDISALCVVVKAGKLLKCWVPGELKSPGHKQNTIGDQIDRIREIRNSFMHSAEANLDESDYDDYIHDINEIGTHFEVINGEQTGTYTKEIEELHDTLFDTSKVEKIVVRYKLYVETILRVEMPAWAMESLAPKKEITHRREKSTPEDCLCYHCRYDHGILCRCYHCRHTQLGDCKCYDCCHPNSKMCKCEDCRPNGECIIL